MSIRSPAAAEEMTSSIAEIAQQDLPLTPPSRAHSAADEVSGASQDVTALSEAAGRIDGVVRLINEIAEKTNLLALNATKSRRRAAGEAGKGFAVVVASEVKKQPRRPDRPRHWLHSQSRSSGIQSATEKAVGADHGHWRV